MTMNHSCLYRRARTLALVPLFLLLPAACQPNYEIPAMTPEETQAIETLTARMAPRCVGRYLIDLPVDFVLNPITTTKLEGVDITITPMERGRFDAVLKARHETMKKERPVAGGGDCHFFEQCIVFKMIPEWFLIEPILQGEPG
jgi:hypothetical protein